MTQYYEYIYTMDKMGMADSQACIKNTVALS